MPVLALFYPGVQGRFQLL